jgi:hypothetical protein
MGQGISLSLNDIPDTTTIYNKTQPTIDIMNKVLDFILKNADYRDMIALANDKECEKWIIISENKLLKLFQKINLQPEQKNGVLYLKKIDTLKQNNDIVGCKLLAAFFIRLFQVVGALSLSVMDTKIPDRADYLVTDEPKQTERKGIPFFNPEGEKKKRYSFFGGLIEEKNIGSIPTNLQIFRRYLTVASSNTYSLTTLPKQKSDAYNVPGYIISTKNNKLIFTSTIGSNAIIFELAVKESEFLIDVITRNGKDYPYSDNFTYAIQTDQSIIVTYISDKKSRDIDFVEFITELRNKIAQLPASQTVKILNDLNYLEQSNVDPYLKKIKGIKFDNEENSGIFLKEKNFKSDEPRFIFGYPIKKDNYRFDLLISFTLLIVKSIQEEIEVYTVEVSKEENNSTSEKLKFKPDFNFENIDEDLDPKLKSSNKTTRRFTVKSGLGAFTSEPTNRVQTIPNYLQNLFNIIKNQALSVIETGVLTSKQGYINPVDDSSLKNTRLKTRELWTNLIRSPPVKSFCTARALQLLNISGLQKNIPDKIRPLIYNTSFDLIKDGSLPRPGQPITTSIGIKALQSLYSNFTDIYDSSTISSTATASSVPLGKILIESFVENEELRKSIKALDNITEESGSKEDVFISKDNKQKVSQLREQARLLFQTQFEHTSKVNTLLQKLFVFSDPITLNPNILSKGIRGIEEVASEARNLLTEYYSSCQIHYNKGIKIIRPPSLAPAPAKN